MESEPYCGEYRLSASSHCSILGELGRKLDVFRLVEICPELWPEKLFIRLVVMELALLGSDYDTVSLTTAAHNLGHAIVWTGDTDWARQEFQLPWLTEQDQHDNWESLLDSGFCDAVLVGRGSMPIALRQEQLSQLMKNGIAVLTSFPIFDSVLAYYEIDMVRNETGALLRHYNPLANYGDQSNSWLMRGREEVGRIEQVRWERPLEDRSRENVVRHFARDVAVLESVAGRLNRLGAHGSGDEAATYSGLSVQLIGKSEIPVQWSVRPAKSQVTSQLTVLAEHGEINASFSRSGQLVSMGADYDDGNADADSIQPADPCEREIEQLEKALTQGGPSSTWPEALHGMELADTIEISLRRGRMIDIHPQQLTEDLAFKGTMSAAGCGVLMILPPLLLFLGWIAGLVGLPVADYWEHALLALLSLFLAIQFLPKLLADPKSETDAADSDLAE